jgi:hypothetical protein
MTTPSAPPPLDYAPAAPKPRVPRTIIASFVMLVLALPVALAIVWRPISEALDWLLDDALYRLGIADDKFYLGWPFWCLMAGIVLAIIGLVQRSRYRLLALGALLLNLSTLIAWVLCVIRALIGLGSTFK